MSRQTQATGKKTHGTLCTLQTVVRKREGGDSELTVVNSGGELQLGRPGRVAARKVSGGRSKFSGATPVDSREAGSGASSLERVILGELYPEGEAAPLVRAVSRPHDCRLWQKGTEDLSRSKSSLD